MDTKNKKMFGLFLAACVVFSLLIIFSANAQRLIYNSYVFAGDSIYVNGKNFIVQRNVQEDALIFKTDEDKFSFVNIYKCTVIEKMNFCFEGKEYDYDKRKNKYLLKIYEPTPEIQISRTINRQISYIGEEAQIEVIVYNEGSSEIKNMLYEEWFPEEIKILSSKSPCEFSGNKVFFEESIKAGSSEKCTYKIKYLGEIYAKLSGKATYYSNDIKKEKLSGLIIFDAKNFVKEEFSFETSPVIVGQETYFFVELTNEKYEESNNAKIELVLPEGIKFISSSNFKKNSEGKYIWEGIITSNETDKSTRKLSVKILPEKSGKYEIQTRAEYSNRKKDITYSKTTYTPLNVKAFPLSIFTSFDSDDIFNGMQEKIFSVRIQNPNEDIKLKNIVLKIWDEITNETRTIRYKELPDTKPVGVITGSITMPDIDRTKKYKIKISASYETEYGEREKTEYEKQITVKPTPKIEILHSFSKTKIQGEESTDLTVKLKNNAEQEINNVKVMQMHEEGLKIRGATSRTMNVYAKTTTNAYTYSIETENVPFNTKYKVTTIIEYSYLDLNYTVEKISEIFVSPKKMSLSATAQIPSSAILGERIDYWVTIKNTEKESVKNIEFSRVYTPETDWIDGEASRKTIKNLDVGEEIKIMIGQFRFKQNETRKTPEIIISFSDYNNNQFSQKISIRNIKITGKKINSPAIIPSIELPARTTEDEITEISVHIENVGEVSTDVEFSLLDRTIDDYFPPEYKKSFSIEQTFGNAGNEEVLLSVSYDYLGSKYETGTQKIIEVVKKREIPAAEDKEKEAEKLADKEITPQKRINITLPALIAITIILIISMFFSKRKKKTSIFIGE